MKTTRATTRYAKTFFEAAVESSILDRAYNDMQVVKDVFANTEMLSSFLSNPLSNPQRKNDILAVLLKGAAPLTSTFIKLLKFKKRLELLNEIPDCFFEFYEKSKNIVRATVFSTYSLPNNQIKKIQTILKKHFKANEVIIINKIDTSLIAGIKIRVGDTIIDANIKNKILQLKRKLAA